jgi:hypothetical protein
MVCVPRLTQRKYKRLLKAVFPRVAQSSEPNGIELEQLTLYALTNPKMLPKAGLYLERRAGKKFVRKEYQHVRVAVHIMNQLIQACHLDLRLFADSAVRLTKFLLRQVEAPDLQIVGCDLLIKFANSNQDEASQLHTLTPFVDDLVRLCHDAQSRPDLRQSIREAGLRSIITIVQLVDSAGLAEQVCLLCTVCVCVCVHACAPSLPNSRLRFVPALALHVVRQAHARRTRQYERRTGRQRRHGHARAGNSIPALWPHLSLPTSCAGALHFEAAVCIPRRQQLLGDGWRHVILCAPEPAAPHAQHAPAAQLPHFHPHADAH